MRAYLVVNAKLFSSFIKHVEVLSTASAGRGKGNGKRTGIHVIVAVTVASIQSVMLAWFLSKSNGSRSWFFPLLGNRLYGILAFFFMSGPMFI